MNKIYKIIYILTSPLFLAAYFILSSFYVEFKDNFSQLVFILYFSLIFVFNVFWLSIFLRMFNFIKSNILQNLIKYFIWAIALWLVIWLLKNRIYDDDYIQNIVQLLIAGFIYTVLISAFSLEKNILGLGFLTSFLYYLSFKEGNIVCAFIIIILLSGLLSSFLIKYKGITAKKIFINYFIGMLIMSLILMLQIF